MNLLCMYPAVGWWVAGGRFLLKEDVSSKQGGKVRMTHIISD